MASREQIIQKLARMYREETGSEDIDPVKFADYLIKQGLTPPRVPSQRELMAKAAKAALKHEIRKDSATGRPYRGWHAVPRGTDKDSGQTLFSYYDIDDAPRLPMEKALALRVSAMVDDGVQVSFDAEHWNRINPNEQPITVDEMLDLRDQVEWRKNARDDEDETGESAEE
ncbi:hypothetical protein D7Y21_19975 [Corallococcus sp. AB045]|uniref:hypothetical protein n=1 Tax=Corallococcus sp. AB045 TaxID=2316719 RepID=UPI000EEF110B|nr:hypothetical protein [Corallococcus sp. AB045]RKH86921.1 hypothetical protein D7Y21_19975 [Corallococcus sp. AB045]